MIELLYIFLDYKNLKTDKRPNKDVLLDEVFIRF